MVAVSSWSLKIIHFLPLQKSHPNTFGLVSSLSVWRHNLLFGHWVSIYESCQGWGKWCNRGCYQGLRICVFVHVYTIKYLCWWCKANTRNIHLDSFNFKRRILYYILFEKYYTSFDVYDFKWYTIIIRILGFAVLLIVLVVLLWRRGSLPS